MKPISLVRKSDEKASSCCVPLSCDDYGTRVYLSGPKDLAAIPEEGTITFKFERCSVTLSDDKDPVRMELKLLSVESAKAEDVSDAEDSEEAGEEDTGIAIDKLLAGMQEETED